jgi:hypothetical protein
MTSRQRLCMWYVSHCYLPSSVAIYMCSSHNCSSSVLPPTNNLRSEMQASFAILHQPRMCRWLQRQRDRCSCRWRDAMPLALHNLVEVHMRLLHNRPAGSSLCGRSQAAHIHYGTAGVHFGYRKDTAAKFRLTSSGARSPAARSPATAPPSRPPEQRTYLSCQTGNEDALHVLCRHQASGRRP